MIEEAHLDQLLEIVGDVGAEIVAARAQLARGQLLVADIVEQQRLHRIDVGAAAAVELVLDDVEQAAMQPLHQRQGFEIERPDVIEPGLPIAAGSTVLATAFMMTPHCCLVVCDEALFPVLMAPH